MNIGEVSSSRYLFLIFRIFSKGIVDEIERLNAMFKLTRHEYTSFVVNSSCFHFAERNFTAP